MICTACREGEHAECPGQTRDRSWCDCQHHDPREPAEPATGHASE